MIKKIVFSFFLVLSIFPLSLAASIQDISPYIEIKGSSLNAKYSSKDFDTSISDKDFVPIYSAGIKWKGFRGEIEYSSNKWSSSDQTLTIASVPVTINKANMNVKTFMFNAFYDFLVEPTNEIYLYVGGGLGSSDLKTSLHIGSLSFSDSKKSAFSWALYAGFMAKVETPPLPLQFGAGYKYQKIKGLQNDDLTIQGFTFGFRYIF